MYLIDWLIVLGFFSTIIVTLIFTSKYNKSVADFLAANRSAGRYLLAVSEGMASLGVISLIAMFEMYYVAGLTAQWWKYALLPLSSIAAITGWLIYRFRQTRALTLAQFFEMRYSRNLRIFSGILSFMSGVINFGIFPAVSARFFIYFCGFHEFVKICGYEISTFAIVMLVLVGVSLYFTIISGQIGIIISEFMQGIFTFVVFTVIIVFLFNKFTWSDISNALLSAPADASLIHPLKTKNVPDFNVWYFLIGGFFVFYNYLSWQGQQAFNSSAINAHESRMARVLGTWRWYISIILVCVVTICVYTVMHNPRFVSESQNVSVILSQIPSDYISKQMTVPVVLANILPMGLLGCFCACMFAATLSTHSTYLHSWGSILVQDVILPFIKKPPCKKTHLLLLRCSIVVVALFIYMFSLFFKQTEYIFLFFAITGAIFTSGAGVAIIGGLYWSRGTTEAAWYSMIIGAILSVGGIIYRQYNPGFFLNGQWIAFLSSVISIIVYVVISLSQKKNHDMDKLLHRSESLQQQEVVVSHLLISRLSQMLFKGKEFSMPDRVLCSITYTWAILWFVGFIVFTFYNLAYDVSDSKWLSFWHAYLLMGMAIVILVVVLLVIGGIKDLAYMLGSLRSSSRNISDNGRVYSETPADLAAHSEIKQIEISEGRK